MYLFYIESHYEVAQTIKKYTSPLVKWPPDSELLGYKKILIGYITSGNESEINEIKPQSSFLNDGAFSLALLEINNSTEILPDHKVQ